MERDGELARVVLKPSEGAVGSVPKGDDGRAQVDLYARLVENFVEGYRVAARGLAALLKGPLAAEGRGEARHPDRASACSSRARSPGARR